MGGDEHQKQNKTKQRLRIRSLGHLTVRWGALYPPSSSRTAWSALRLSAPAPLLIGAQGQVAAPVECFFDLEPGMSQFRDFISQLKFCFGLYVETEGT